MYSDGRPTIMFVGVLLAGFIIYFTMLAVQPLLSSILFDYTHWFDSMKDSAWHRFLWLLGDGTEPHFHKTLFGGIGVLIGSGVAYFLDKKNHRLAGLPISYGTGLWPWVLLASWISLALSGLLYGSLRFEGDGWLPTFVPYVSVASAVIFVYGGNFRNVLTGAVLGVVFTAPISIILREEVCIPWGIPGVVSAVSGMWIGGILVFEVCRHLPWMKRVPLPPRPKNARTMPSVDYIKANKNSFFLRRLLADYSEPMFVGNEIAGLCLIVGSVLSWALNPLHTVYGTGWLPAILLSQIITGAVALYLFWPTFVEGEGGGVPTFVPLVSVGPAIVLTYGPSMFNIVVAAVLGAVISPPVAVMVNKRLPSHSAPLIGNTFAMAVCAFAVGVFFKLLLQAFPALGAL